MKKNAAIILTAFLLIGVLLTGLGCKKQETPVASSPVTITYWQYFFEAKVNLLDEIIPEFEKQNPGIKVEQVTFPYESYNQKVASSVPVGTGPEILNLFYGWLPMYVKNGYLQALPQSDFSAAYFKENFFPFVEQSVKFDNKYYSVPTAVRTLALLWNKKLFREAGLDPNRPPATLEELLDYAKKLSKYDAQGNLVQSGLSMLTAGQGHSWIREVLIRQFGGVPYSDDGRRVTYNTPQAAEALKWYTDRITVDKIGSPTFVPDDPTGFRNETLAMVIDGSFRIGTYRPLASLEWAVAEIPTRNGIKSNYASFWTNAIADGVKGDKLAASVKFLKFLASPEVQAKWLDKVGELPANPRFAAQQANVQYVGEFLKGLEYAHATIFVDETGQRDVFVNMVDEVYLNNVSPAQALRAAAEKEQKLIDDFWK
jgi:multiple sugar transport system substrate-binding protein